MIDIKEASEKIKGFRVPEYGPSANPYLELHPESEWDEDFGAVLWWKSPIDEPPYAGTPLDCDWPGYHTHWTIIPVPEMEVRQ